jgi:L-iditol 2-dehydrogenase
MKTIRLHGPHNIRLHDEAVPTPAVGEKLLKITSAGICGSDVHWFKEVGIGNARLTHPLVLGHEFAAVTESGERVAVDPAIPCGKCEFCMKGHPNLCPHTLFAGPEKDVWQGHTGRTGFQGGDIARKGRRFIARQN